MTSDPYAPFTPVSEEDFHALPQKEQAAYLRAWDALQSREIAPLPLPSTIDTLRLECEEQRMQIILATNLIYSFTGKLTNNEHGREYSSFARLWFAAMSLDVKSVPPLPCGPLMPPVAIAALDALIAALGGSAPAKAGESTKTKRRKSGRPVDTDTRLDRRIFDAWHSKKYRSHREVGEEFRLTSQAVKRAIDRERKRRKK